jgi:hypothetical protein
MQSDNSLRLGDGVSHATAAAQDYGGAADAVDSKSVVSVNLRGLELLPELAVRIGGAPICSCSVSAVLKPRQLVIRVHVVFVCFVHNDFTRTAGISR